MNLIVESLYRISGVDNIFTESFDGNDNTILDYDSYIDFTHYVANKFIDLFKFANLSEYNIVNKLPFYVDGGDLVDATDYEGRTAEYHFCSRGYTYKQAYNRIEQLLDMTSYMTNKANVLKDKLQKQEENERRIEKEKEEAKSFPDLAKRLKMQYHDREGNGFRSLFSRDKMSYGNGFAYNDIFEKDNLLKNQANKIIGDNLIKALWRNIDDKDLLLVATPGFNFLTDYSMFIDDLNKNFNGKIR